MVIPIPARRVHPPPQEGDHRWWSIVQLQIWNRTVNQKLKLNHSDISVMFYSYSLGPSQVIAPANM